MIQRRQWLRNAWGLGLSLGALKANAHPALHWKRIDFVGLGTTLSIQAAHSDESKLSQALAQARERIAIIEAQMSLFKVDSDLSQLNREGMLKRAPHHLLHVLQQAQHYARVSDGAFDATVQPLWQLYAQAQAQGRLPSPQEVAQAKALVDWRAVQFDDEAIYLMKPGMGVTLNGIAQGYASDQLKAVLQSWGVAHALINAGEWSAVGQSAHHRDWVLGIADPRSSDDLLARVHMSGMSMATSADDQTSFSADHVHHHIFDPHTGYSPRDVASVSVIAATCTQADALTKIFFVKGYDQALDVAHAFGVQALVVHKSGQYQMTKGFPLV